MHASDQIDHQDLLRVREPSFSFPLVAFLDADREHQVLDSRRDIVGVHAWIGSPPFDIFEKLLSSEQVYQSTGGDVVFSYEGFDFVRMDSGDPLLQVVDGFGLCGFDEGVS
jgi:hypothetical protein